MHNIEDETVVIGDVYLPIVIRLNFLCVIFEQFADKPRQLDAKGSMVISFDVQIWAM
jgi:hypothetical protein